MLVIRLNQSNEVIIRTSDGDMRVRLGDNCHSAKICFEGPRKIKVDRANIPTRQKFPNLREIA